MRVSILVTLSICVLISKLDCASVSTDYNEGSKSVDENAKNIDGENYADGDKDYSVFLSQPDAEDEEDQVGFDYNKDHLPVELAYLIKRDPMRTRELMRKQAARWELGFGKRAGAKSKSFMDALYGKRSFLRNTANPQIFGRKQHWDIQYGKK